MARHSILLASLGIVAMTNAHAVIGRDSTTMLDSGLDGLVRNATAALSQACTTANEYAIRSASSDADFDADFDPSNVIDGDLSTDSRWSSKDSAPSITLDLGSAKTVGGIGMAWYKADTREAYFDVQTSSDGRSWDTVIADGSITGTQDLRNLELPPSSARYVRIIGGGNSDSDWTSLIEAKVYGCSGVDPDVQACTGGDSLEISRATSADKNDAGYVPANAVDGDLSGESRWSSNGEGRSLIVDLGEPSVVTDVAIAWYKGDERDAYFDVRTSLDSANWTTVLSSATAGGTRELIAFDVTESTARYVEIIGRGNSYSSWNSITEINVLGCGNIDSTVNSPVVLPEPTEPPGPVESSPPVETPQPVEMPEPVEESQPASDVNVVFNGTFENNLSGWAQVEPAQGSSDAYEGLGSGKIFDSGSISQSIFVIPQSRYRVSGFLQGDPTLGIRVNGETVTAAGPDAGEVFERVSFEFDSGTATTAELFVRASSSSDTARADDIEVVQISGGDNSVPVDPNDVFDFSLWEVEGETPITRDGTLSFDALEQCVVTPNGNGCRHEMKISESERYGLTEQYELFRANIEVGLSLGAETIVVQHHPEATGTLAALYVTDRQDAWPNVENGVARDGIFDVVVTVRIPGSTDNESVVLGTVRSGGNFDYEVINDHGNMIISAFGKTVQVQSADSSASYLKFGNYLQARDPVTGVRMELDKPLGPEDRADFLAYYRSKGINEAVIVFRDVEYSRTID